MTSIPPLIIKVLLGSVRTDRQGIKAARLLLAAIQKRGHEAGLVDPMVTCLPLLDRMSTGSEPAELEQPATLYRLADGFLLVSAEYNHGVLPALKNLLDRFLEEYCGALPRSLVIPLEVLAASGPPCSYA